MSTSSFYQDHVPQSEYRRTGEKKDRVALDLVLSKMSVTDPQLKRALIQKIEEETDKMATLLLPESVVKNLNKKAFIPGILKELGLG